VTPKDGRAARTMLKGLVEDEMQEQPQKADVSVDATKLLRSRAAAF
jgi:hypothetical protein